MKAQVLIASGICLLANHTLTEGKDKRLYHAAKKLADCWVANIGPGKKDWYDGHQEMEQALVRFGRFVNDMEGSGRGDSYVKLAKFLLDCRKYGSESDQSHVPAVQQYEAVGHAVRAVYSYSATRTRVRLVSLLDLTCPLSKHEALTLPFQPRPPPRSDVRRPPGAAAHCGANRRRRPIPGWHR